MASTGYEVLSGSTLHQVHDATADEDPVEVPDEDANPEKEKEEDNDEVSYLGTSQPGQLGFGIPPASTDDAPISSKSKKKKQTKLKMDDKAEEAALCKKRKTDHEMACNTLYHEDYLAIQVLQSTTEPPQNW